MLKRNTKHGFTVIELMLAMAFISMLLLTIALTTIQAGKQYNYGLVLRSVNFAGRDISDVIRRDFIQTDQRQVSGTATDSVITVYDAGQPISGRFCLGDYSYVWNFTRVLDTSSASTSVVRDPDGNPINFVRVADENSDLCDNSSGAYPTGLVDNAKITHLLKTKASAGEVVLSVHDLDVVPMTVVPNDSDGLYRVDLTIGTSKLEEINTLNRSCRPPSDAQSNIQFCAINQFNMTVRTNG